MGGVSVVTHDYRRPDHADRPRDPSLAGERLHRWFNRPNWIVGGYAQGATGVPSDNWGTWDCPGVSCTEGDVEFEEGKVVRRAQELEMEPVGGLASSARIDSADL